MTIESYCTTDSSIVNSPTTVDLIFPTGESRNSLEMVCCCVKEGTTSPRYAAAAAAPLESVRSHLYLSGGWWRNADTRLTVCTRQPGIRTSVVSRQAHKARQTDPPLCDTARHYKRPFAKETSIVIVARGGGPSSRRGAGWLCLFACLW